MALGACTAGEDGAHKSHTGKQAVAYRFDAQFDFAAWERLTNPDVYGLAVQEEQVAIARTWCHP